MTTAEPPPRPDASPTIVHEGVPIARDVRFKTSFWEQTLGAVGRGIPLDAALVFPLDGPEQVAMTNLLVPEPIDVVFVVEEQVTRTDTMPAWRGSATGLADTVIELAAGGAETIHADDTVRVVEVRG